MAGKNKSKLTEGEEILLRSMFPRGKDLTIKEIMEHTPYSSYERNNTYLKSLAEKNVIQEKKIGKTFVYSIKSDTWFSKQAFHMYAFKRVEEFSEKHAIIAKAIRELPEELTELIIIFGSYAKEIERKESDIDILIVSSEKEKIETALVSIKRRYGFHLHPIVIQKSEFTKIKNENKELWGSLIKYGILFKGYELFYQHAYRI